MQKLKNFYLPTGTNFSLLIQKLTQVHTIQYNFKKREKFKLYDTFDWRLFKHNFFLLKNTNFFEIVRISDGISLEKFQYNQKQNLEFWWDFPAGSVKERLESILDVRALTEKVCFTTSTKQYSVLNRDEKTVVRFEYQLLQIPDFSKKTISLHVIPLRGYSKEANGLERTLLKSGCKHHLTNPILSLIKTKGIQPGEYSSKLNISLLPMMSLHQALIAIFRRLLQIFNENIEGIKSDIDTEFLHDFRVAIRKTRSALMLIKGIFPISETDRFERDFAYIGSKTNNLRDLDVYLLKKNNFEKILPNQLKLELRSFFLQLEEERRLEHRNIVNFLNSKKFKQILKNWEYFLSDKNTSEKGVNYDKPVLAGVKMIIFKRYRKMVSKGNKITDETPDRKLHQLRIEGKKLRYLLEFFSSLFPLNEMTLLLRQLKKLQDHLGDFNDLAVQQAFLNKYLPHLKSNDESSLKIAAAFGGLIVAFNIKQKEIRHSFKVIFKEFSNKQNDQIFVKLFS